jgi:hypothetical protein
MHTLQLAELSPAQLLAFSRIDAHAGTAYSTLSQTASDNILWQHYSPGLTLPHGNNLPPTFFRQAFAKRWHSVPSIERPLLESLLSRIYAARVPMLFLAQTPAGGRNFDAVLGAVRRNGHELSRAHPLLKAVPALALAAVQHTGEALKHVAMDQMLPDDEEAIVLAAVQRDGRALQHAPRAMRANPKIVQAAVRENGMALQWAAPHLQADPSTVRWAVQQNGMALKWAAPGLWSSREIGLIAVARNGAALKLLIDDLQKDSEIALAAVRSNGMALQYVRGEAALEWRVVYAAVAQNGAALRHACAAWQHNAVLCSLAEAWRMQSS